MLNCVKAFLGALFVAVPLACGAKAVDKSTGSNWLGCTTDADCSPYGGATCGTDKYCVYPNGTHVTSLDIPDAAVDAAVEAGVEAGPTTIVVDCFSPGQYLDQIYSATAVGCECPESTTPFCIQGISLSCEAGRWSASSSSACGGCWTPDQADFIASYPDRGCACTTENETACSTSTQNGTEYSVCTGGKWTRVSGTLPPYTCTCTEDKECGFGRLCVGGSCLPGLCEVNGVRYSAGYTGIPHPTNCQTCTCEIGGTLSCVAVPCPSEGCPAGTSAASECVVCGQSGYGCDLRRTGCLTTCANDYECGFNYLTTCDPQSHACHAGCE